MTNESIDKRHILSVLSISDVISVLNALLGFSAIVILTDALTSAEFSEDAIWKASVLILLAAAADGFDGVIARRVQRGPLGIYLDSLADMTSFGFATAFIAYIYLHLSLITDSFESTFISYLSLFHLSHIFIAAICGIYLTSGMLRLARFIALSERSATSTLSTAFNASGERCRRESGVVNSQISQVLQTSQGSQDAQDAQVSQNSQEQNSQEQESRRLNEASAEDFFLGFPITGSAVIIASLVIVLRFFPSSAPSAVSSMLRCIILISFMVVLSVMMCSRVRYEKVSGRRIVIPLLALGVVLLPILCFFSPLYPALIVFALSFAYLCSPLFKMMHIFNGRARR